jgi:pimeloyl-ACP methyl ester carboxylesterase
VFFMKSVYDRLRFDDRELTAMLASGTGRRELVAMFGAPEHAQLAALARRAQRAPRRHAAPVYLLPGIMGTQLGSERAAPEPADLLWLDPIDVIAGGLERLQLPGTDTLRTLGALAYSYLALQLRLRAAGHEVIVHEYDWRADLRTLASELAARWRSGADAQVTVVAHSMGGLIARAALALPGGERVSRMVTLGAPQRGSFGAAQAIRGTYPTVRRLAALDRLHDAEYLAQRVFATFPSIHQLLPWPGLGASPDLWEAANWPAAGPRPDPRLLSCARDFVGALPELDARTIAICGVRQRTVVALALRADQFDYRVTDAGDGTVPLESAQHARGDNYYVRCEHSALPRSASVGLAVLDLLRHGRTARLPGVVPTVAAERAVVVSDVQLRTIWRRKVDWARLGTAARRSYLNRLNKAPPQYAPPRVARAAPRG